MRVSHANLFAFSVALGCAFSLTALAEVKNATKAEFVAAVAGKTMATKAKSGKPVAAVYDAKGTGTLKLGDAEPAKFTWSFKGDTLCSVFKSMKFTECNKVHIIDAAKVDFVDAKTGKLNNHYTVQ